MTTASPLVLLLCLGALVVAALIVIHRAFAAWRRVNSVKYKKLKAPRTLLPKTCGLCMRAKMVVARRSWCRSGMCAAHCDIMCKLDCAKAFLKVVGEERTLH